ncbi:BA75_03830T0 [Komagataella pastoris]|uniref:BA75_03830T0 n=1 Tax=Komagataella pastoris TaxID=4922 RepID=A0A1B2JFS2_PICPA|nr:BA75_03830T0 [Komagataella pastoris]
MSFVKSVTRVGSKYLQFVGPGLLISISYLDVGNYSVAVSAGGAYGYKLLYSIILSNIFAVILQCLCIKVGSVTGLNLAELCRKHLPHRLNIVIYILAEFAIIATDLAEVVGAAIALNILFNIPLAYGIIITVLDVVIVLFAYKDSGSGEKVSLAKVRFFEMFLSIFVFLTCVCVSVLLFKIEIPDKRSLFEGFFPVSKDILEKRAVYLGLGVLGATVMPHSLYLGSALVQNRLKDYDVKNGFVDPKVASEDTQDVANKYKPSIHALNYCLKYSYWELVLSLFTIAVFVNAALMVVAGATLFGQPDTEDADLITIYELLSKYVSSAAGFIFALSLLFSGQSSGIVCTMSGQIVSEGFIKWSVTPWVRRLITRLLAVMPCMFMVLFMERKGMSEILNASQVALSLILPFVSAPLLYFTCSSKFMKVEIKKSTVAAPSENTALLPTTEQTEYKDYTNGPFLKYSAIITWALITIFNFVLVFSFMIGEDVSF